VVHDLDSTCAIHIAADNSDIIDYFSYSQVRRLATDILGVCQDQGGLGGYAPLGNEIGWTVYVVGTITVRRTGEQYLQPYISNSSTVSNDLGLGKNASSS